MSERARERSEAEVAAAGAEPVAVVGLAALFPKAEGLDEYWRNLREGVDCISDVPPSHWKPEEYFDADPRSPDRTYARRGGFLPAVRLSPMDLGVTPNALEATDSAQLLGLEVARRALEDAGYGASGRAFDRDRASVILGVTGTLSLVIPLGARLGHPIWRRALREAGVDAETAEDVVKRIADGYVPWKEDSFPGLLGNVVAGRIANRLDLRGTNCVVDAACASSLSSVHLALLELADRRCDLALTGGVDTFNDIFMFMCFSKTPALSPTGDARPFDAAADGTALGEGIGMLVLKRLKDAERDGDRIYAVIRGVGSSSDGKGEAIYAPTAGGQVRALRAAYRAAGVSPSTVEMVEAHGTGTKVGDGIELQALTEVFREARAEGTWCALGSVKSQLGHTKAAAGAAGLLKAALALHRKVLPPTLKVTRPLEPLASGRTPFYLNTVKRPWLPARGHARRAGVSAFGFGGSNFHCVLEEHGDRRTAADWDGEVQIVPLAAGSRAECAAAVAAFPRDLPWPEFRAKAAAARRSFDPSRPCRLALVVERGRTDLPRLLDGARTLLEKPGGRATWSTPDGAHFAEGPAPGGLGVLFPGQGSQYAGMLRDLACRFPEMLDVLAEADETFAPGAGRRLSDLLYPPPAFDEGGAERQEADLRATQVAQPAIGAVSLGALRVLESFGVAADAVAGHSYGELLALCAGGRYDERALHRLSGLRGRLMADAREDLGSMLAVQAPLDTVERVLREERLDLVVANRNAPNQAVVSGTTREIERAEATFASREIRAKRLAVGAAFHSPLVAHARGPMREALRDTEFRPPRIPVWSNGTAREYPADADEAREMLAGQLATPVEFVRIVENMSASGVHTFLEVGPGARLSSLIGSILGERPHEAFALDSSSGKRPGMADLAAALARIAVLGHAVDLTRWDPAAPAAPTTRAGLTVDLSGVNYRSPRSAAAPAPAPSVPPALVPAAVPLPAPGRAVAPRPTAGAAVPDRGSLQVLVRLAEQTAEVHRQFLEGQDRLRVTLEAMLSGAPLPAPRPAEAASFVPVIPAPPASGSDEIGAALLRAVSEKTGYPVEMLTLDMGMDADLGIDSIKRVEILSAVQERMPGLQAVRPDRLGSFRTLRDVAEHLAGGRGPSAVAAAVAAPAPAAPAAAPAESGALAQVLLRAVADRTGYPVEMLGLGMSLDADLGIDSIKRVEILSAVQEKVPGLPVVRPDMLGRFRNLGEIVAFLSGGAAPVAAAPAVPPAPAPAAAGPPASQPRRSTPPAPPAPPSRSGPAASGLSREVLRVVPWTPPAAREPVAVARGAEVWVTDTGDELAGWIAAAFAAKGLAARVVPPAGPAAAPGSLGGLVLAAPLHAEETSLRDALAAATLAAAALRRAGREGGAFLVSLSRCDGAFGLDTGENPVAAGLAGLLKTAAREWPEVNCRAFDLDPRADALEAAARTLASEARLRGPVETSLTPAGGPRVLETAAEPLPAEAGEVPARPGEVIVVSGGARGVTAACAVALGRATGSTLLLLGRSPTPGLEPAWARGIAAEPDLKRAFLASTGGKAGPREVEAAWRDVAAAREIAATLAAVEAAGARAVYREVDVRNAVAVRTALAEARRDLGPVVGIVHGAGVLADALLERKTPEQAERVVGTKVGGLRTLLDAAAGDDLRFLAVFTSTTGRLGRSGQADYAAANEAAARLARRESRRRPGCRVLALGWGPWEGGMVTPSLARVFAGEGIAMIPLAEGAEHLVREIAASRPGDPVEAVVMAATPDAERPAAAAAVPAAPPPAPGLSRAFDLAVDPRRMRFLRSHVLDGRPVVPAAVLLEWIAHGALHGSPGFAFHGVEDFRVLRGVVLEGGAPVAVRVLAGRPETRGDLRAVPVEIRGAGEPGALHARGLALLALALPTAPPRGPLPPVAHDGRTPSALYPDSLFHGPDLQGIEVLEGIGAGGAILRARPAPAPREWIEDPMRGAWLADPMALDVAFQGAILWSLRNRGAPCLPTGLSRYVQWRRAFPKDGVRVVLRASGGGGHAARFDVEFLDDDGGLVARMEGCDCVVDPSLRAAFGRREIASP